MNTFLLITPNNEKIRFDCYLAEAPQTCKAFSQTLPFACDFFHARFSGAEIWCQNEVQLNIPQENASVNCLPGEFVCGPMYPTRVKTANCLGIYYGEGKGIDCANIFACVHPDDKEKLKALGDLIWRKGSLQLRFEALPY